MKNRFNFNLDPKKILPYWLLFIVFYLIPYVFLNYRLQQIQSGGSSQTEVFVWGVAIFVIILIALALYFYFIRLFLESLEFKEVSLSFRGSFGEYFGKNLLGIVLTVITLGVYSPWFVADLCRFFAGKTSYESDDFRFSGKGLSLFLIVTFTLIVPSFALGFLTAISKYNGQDVQSIQLIQSIFMIVITPVYMYLVYRWFVDLDFRDYHISWETTFFRSVGKILLEMILTILTVGIYFPMACLRLYNYFVDRTIARSSDRKYQFGFDAYGWSDFLFLWGQILLCLITLTVYVPWAWSKMGQRFISKTYMEEEEASV